MQIIRFVIILLPFVGTIVAQSSAECAALADLWNSTNGPSWSNTWPSQPPTNGCSAVCTWHGITCSGGTSGSITQMFVHTFNCKEYHYE